MSSSLPSAYVQQHLNRFITELKDWLRIPSISANPAHAHDVRAAADFAVTQLRACGFAGAQRLDTASHPLVYAEWLHAPDQPTVLIYGHFDVQPPEPLDEWTIPPFEPTERDGNLYARGAADDKGQVMLVLKALEALHATTGAFPVNIKVLLEGEEETTGEAIHAYVPAHAQALATDAVLICDTHMLQPGRPALMTGLRGLLYTEITVHGAATDLHSGLYGGVAPNPLHALAHIIAGLKDADGHITIPGLLELLPPMPVAEQTFWHTDPLGLAANYRTEMGVDALVGPASVPALQRVMAYPTVEVHGIKGGFVGEGAKTVIPAVATAKVSIRLPGGVDPAQVLPLLEHAVAAHTPAGHRSHVRQLAAGQGMVVDVDNPAIRAAARALTQVYGQAPDFVRGGGSIPVATLFAEKLQAPVVLMGFGLPDARLPAPNEKFSLDQFHRGILSVIGFLGAFAHKA